MEKLLGICVAVFACLTTMVSCKKDNNDAPKASFGFQANGTNINWYPEGATNNACILCLPALVNYTTYYNLSSSAPQDMSESLLIQIKGTNLNIGTYSDTLTVTVDPIGSPHRLFTPALRAGATEPGDYASVTITSIKEGKYHDGTFKARLTAAPYGPAAPKVFIENGVFRNVPWN
jgi:hypothetical protein